MFRFFFFFSEAWVWGEIQIQSGIKVEQWYFGSPGVWTHNPTHLATANQILNALRSQPRDGRYDKNVMEHISTTLDKNHRFIG